jgi:RNA polymerase sigma factor (sigma-70 family)
MVGQESEFQRLLNRVQAGSDEAVEELIEVYGPLILLVTRGLLRKQFRARYDSQDFVQAVWATLFGMTAPWQRFAHPTDLAGFLTTLARNKVLEEMRRRKNALSKGDRSIDQQWMDRRLAARQPTPSQFVVAKERWEQINEDEPEQNRDILSLRYEGENNSEIARRLNMNESTVRRIVERMFREDQVQSLLGWEDDEWETPH